MISLPGKELTFSPEEVKAAVLEHLEFFVTTPYQIEGHRCNWQDAEHLITIVANLAIVDLRMKAFGETCRQLGEQEFKKP